MPVCKSLVKIKSQEQTNSSSEKNVLSESATGLTQQINELTINDDTSRFLIPVGTILFHPNKKINYIESPSWSTAGSCSR